MIPCPSFFRLSLLRTALLFVSSFFIFPGLVLQSVVFPAVVVADSSGSRGRLPSGQAYRTDPKGNQIVDYIAELEVTNEALERRIRGLVAEIDDLRLGSARARRGSSSQIVEKELISGEPLGNVRQEGSSSIEASSRGAQPQPAARCGERECEIFISEVRTRAQRQLTEAQSSLINLRRDKQSCDQQYSSFKTAVGEQEKGIGELQKQTERANLRVASLEDVLQQREADLERSRGVVAQQQREIEKLQDQVRASSAALQMARESSSATRASLNSNTYSNVASSASATEMMVSDTYRNQVQTSMKNLIKLRNKRDALYKSYSSNKVSVQKKSIRSRDGKLPEQLLGIVKSSNNPRELKLIEKEVSRMEKLIMADISLIKRLK